MQARTRWLSPFTLAGSRPPRDGVFPSPCRENTEIVNGSKFHSILLALSPSKRWKSRENDRNQFKWSCSMRARYPFKTCQFERMTQISRFTIQSKCHARLRNVSNLILHYKTIQITIRSLKALYYPLVATNWTRTIEIICEESWSSKKDCHLLISFSKLANS